MEKESRCLEDLTHGTRAQAEGTTLLSPDQKGLAVVFPKPQTCLTSKTEMRRKKKSRKSTADEEKSENYKAK